ncbi:MAG: DUF3883 domain-containing protein [Chloroflexi bacterium]|nr:DUF3883 domain-containing protein [Chloroflexota bacterium]
MNTQTAKLPQNVQALIGEIGEKYVMLHLLLRTLHTSWEVFHNLGEFGYDILLLNTETDSRVRLEVKTRQKLYTTGRHTQRVQFFLTEREYQACDFLVACLLLPDSFFFIVSREDLKVVRVNQRPRWRFTVTLNSQGQPHPCFREYLNAWESIHPDFRLPDEVIPNLAHRRG